MYNNKVYEFLVADVRDYVDSHLEQSPDGIGMSSGTVGAPMLGLLGGWASGRDVPRVDSGCRQVGLLGDFGAAGPAVIMDRLEDGFSTLLLRFIRQRGMSNSDVYKQANLDRRLFSKIISNADYTPAKNTVLALVVALRLDLGEADSLLRSAGYALSHSQKVDLVVEYFITMGGGGYNIFQINDVLESLGLPALGSKQMLE